MVPLLVLDVIAAASPSVCGLGSMLCRGEVFQMPSVWTHATLAARTRGRGCSVVGCSRPVALLGVVQPPALSLQPTPLRQFFC